MNWVPVAKATHSDKAVGRDRNYLFAKNSTLLPVGLREMALAVAHVPLIFYQIEESIEICALLGLDKDQNVFVNDDGSWSGEYIPLILRRHPFATRLLQNGNLAIVHEEGSDLIVNRDDGDPFFNADGSEGEVFKNLAALAAEFNLDRARAKKACSLLKEFELLKPLTYSFKKDDGSVTELINVYRIDKTELNELEEQKFTKLRDTSTIDMIYAHFFSMNSFSILIRMANERRKIESKLKGLGQKIFADNEQEMDFDF